MPHQSAAFLFTATALLATASAQATIVHSAFDTPVYEDNRSMGGPNLLLAIKTQMPSSTVVTRIEVFTGEGTGPNTLAIWSHDPAANAPQTQLGVGGFAMCRRNDWQGALLSTAVPLGAGQDIWIVWGCQNGAQASSAGTGAGAQPYRGSFTGGASWTGPFQSVQWKFRLWTGTAGHYEVYGSGCAGSNGVPQLCWSGMPRTGGTFELHLSRAPANAGTVLTFGFSDASFNASPLPFGLGVLGAPGCNVLAAPEVTTFVLADLTGAAMVQVALPANSALTGLMFFDQWFCLDAGANALGLTVSNGGKAIVGS